MEEGISGCSTLTKLYLEHLPPQCVSASVRAAMTLQASLGEVGWFGCSFRSKSNIGVTVLACCVWCVHGCVVRDRGREGEIVCVYFVFVGAHGHVHVCVCVCLLKCICIVNIVTRCVGSESARVHVHLLQISFAFLCQVHFRRTLPSI